MEITEKDIGRRVLVNGKVDEETFTKELGTIKYIDSCYNIGVEFDKARNSLHTCSGFTEENRGWWVREEHITFVEDEKKTEKAYSGLDVDLPEVQALIGKEVMFSDNGIKWLGPFKLKKFDPLDNYKFVKEFLVNYNYIKTIPEPFISNCYFCGSSATSVITTYTSVKDKVDVNVRCKACEADGPRKPTKEAAIKAWNKD